MRCVVWHLLKKNYARVRSETDTSCRNIKRPKKLFGYYVGNMETIFKNVYENPVGKEMKHYFFGSFRRKVKRSNGTSEKVVPFLRTECSKQKFVFLFFKADFNTRVGTKKSGLLVLKSSTVLPINTHEFGGKRPEACQLKWRASISSLLDV